MQLTLRLLGFEVLHVSTDVVEFDDDDEDCSLDGGTTAAYPIGFTVSTAPFEHDCPAHIEE